MEYNVKLVKDSVGKSGSIKVSVCVPIYGVEKYIEKCVRSLFEQTMTEGIEFIFVNDCPRFSL